MFGAPFGCLCVKIRGPNKFTFPFGFPINQPKKRCPQNTLKTHTHTHKYIYVYIIIYIYIYIYIYKCIMYTYYVSSPPSPDWRLCHAPRALQEGRHLLMLRAQANLPYIASCYITLWPIERICQLQLSQNQTRVLKWSTQMHVKSRRGGHTHVWLRLSPTIRVWLDQM